MYRFSSYLRSGAAFEVRQWTSLPTVVGRRTASTEIAAVTRKKQPYAQQYETAEEILSQVEVQAVLQSNGGAGESLGKEQKLTLLSHLSEKYSEPIPSNALQHMNTASDIAGWFSNRLKPIGALPHTRKMIHAALLGEGATQEDIEQLDHRIDLDREAVQAEFIDRIPPNLHLTRKTFKQATPHSLREKVISPKAKRLTELKWSTRATE